MTRVTKFAARDSGPSVRVSGFVAHLRDNGFRLGIADTELALQALVHIEATDPASACRALKAVCTGCSEEAQRFETLFDAYWRNGGRVRPKVRQASAPPAMASVRSSRAAAGQTDTGGGQAEAPDGGEGNTEAGGNGKLVASGIMNLARTDLRDLVQPEDIRAAEAVARRIGMSLRDKRSRRRKAALRGDHLNFRKTIRHSLSTGGEPIHLFRRRRPDRPVRIVALCDVSGSMTVYSRIFLAFLAGLLRSDATADAYLFHTRLVRIADALRDKDAMRAMGRLSVMAEGYGGGSKIGASLTRFAKTYARRFVDGRTVVIILSDGYDTDPPDHLQAALASIRKRGCKIIWLNPLKGWNGYEPVARGMAAALPFLDLFRPANRLSDIAALEPELVRL